MAEVRCRDAKRHIVDRFVERLYAKNAARRGEAASLLDDAVSTLREQAPDDWRFTRHPSACFFISLLVACPVPGHKAQTLTGHVKLLGATYRESEAGQCLEELLRLSVETSEGSEGRGCGRESLAQMADLYLADLEAPDSTIVHELRTAYSPGGAIGQRRDSTETRLASHPHTAIMRGIRSPTTRAAMPNAILCRTSPDRAFELLVRQGERWSRMRRDGHADKQYALFCPLAADGVHAGGSSIWSFGNNGALKREADGVATGVLGSGWSNKPQGYRNEIYWLLPTRLDVLRMDLDYELREKAHTMGARQSMQARIIDWVTELALSRAGLQPPPTWYSKT